MGRKLVTTKPRSGNWTLAALGYNEVVHEILCLGICV